MFSIFSSTELSATDRGRLRRLERKVDLVMKHLGVVDDASEAGGLPSEVRLLADEGKKIEAIKVHRELLGTGLREAKEAVDAYLQPSS